ncbi:MAG: hypothetical protein AAGF92_11470 [Myxococcota bacterium]
MRLLLGIALCCSFGLGGCSQRSECTSAAEPYLDRFETTKRRTDRILDLRRANEQRRLLVAAFESGDDTALPQGLKAIYRGMKRDGAEVDASDVEEGEATFWRFFDMMFDQDPDVLQGEVVLIQRDDSVSAFRYPREREVPAGLRWHGLRQSRTFCAVADCLVETGVEPCVLIQLRPRDYGGSAGLTVGYRRSP